MEGFIIIMVCYDQGKREGAGNRNKLQAPQVMAQNKTFFQGLHKALQLLQS